MDSSNLSEDGMSERIRYSQGSGQNDSIKDYIWTTLPSDQVITKTQEHNFNSKCFYKNLIAGLCC